MHSDLKVTHLIIMYNVYYKLSKRKEFFSVSIYLHFIISYVKTLKFYKNNVFI